MQFFIWNILILILCVFSGDVIMDVNFANIGKNFETALILPNATLKIEGAIGTKTQLNPLFAELLLSKWITFEALDTVYIHPHVLVMILHLGTVDVV